MKHKHGCADLQLCLQRDAERVQIVGNTQSAIKWISRLLSLVFFLVLQTNPQKVPESKEWKAMKNCSGRTKKSQYHLQKGSVLSCAPLHSHKWGVLQDWTREQPSCRASKQDFRRKEESKKAQLNYPHPSNNFCGQRTTPLAATFMSCEVGFPASSFCLLYGDKNTLLQWTDLFTGTLISARPFGTAPVFLATGNFSKQLQWSEKFGASGTSHTFCRQISHSTGFSQGCHKDGVGLSCWSIMK